MQTVNRTRHDAVALHSIDCIALFLGKKIRASIYLRARYQLAHQPKGAKAMIVLLFAVLSTSAPTFFCVEANGKGPIGIYAISRRHAITVDSNLDALLAVDLLRGGTVGYLKLHGPDLDVAEGVPGTYAGGKDKAVEKGWVDPTGVASCDVCRYIYLTSTHGHNFYQIELEMPLLEMSRQRDFSALSRGMLRPVWPWDANATGVGEPTSSVRMLEVHRDGSIGYMAHRTYGVLRFYLDLDGQVRSGDVLLGMADLGNPDGVVAGLTLSGENEERLLVTASRSALIVGVDKTGRDAGTLEQVVPLQSLCNGSLGTNMWFRDCVIVRGDDGGEYMYVVGLFTPGQDGRGMSLYQLTKDHKSGEWIDCVNVAGPQKEHGGWRDGLGDAVRFTRPHEFTLLPQPSKAYGGEESLSTLSGNVLLLSDCDNRALRIGNLNPGQIHRISTVQYYEENFWWPTEGKDKSTSQSDGVRVATFDPQISASKFTFPKMRDWCRDNADGADICPLADIRTSFNDDLFTFADDDDVVTVWSLDSCFGCWLRFPGTCDIKEGGWDSNYRMVTTFDKSGRIRTECTLDELEVSVVPFCCGTGNFGVTTSSDSAKDDTKESQSGADPQSVAAAPDEDNKWERSTLSTIGLTAACGGTFLAVILGFALFRWHRKRQEQEPTYDIIELVG